MMITKKQFDNEIQRIIYSAIREDVGEGDHSALACIPEGACGRAQLIVKDRGIIAGVAFAKAVFTHVDKRLRVEICIDDGSEVTYGDVVMFVEGPSRSILKAERTVLNAMQRMSAIATKTRQFVALVKGTKATVLDTRKTTPGIRAIEKWAVRIGGGENHRFALYDMIMLKDNHIDFSGSIAKAIEMSKRYLKAIGKEDMKIIVEARNLKEVEEILNSNGIYRILLDNFSYKDTESAVLTVGGACPTESSGNIDASTIAGYAACGVDYISCGALTHAICNMDLSLKAINAF